MSRSGGVLDHVGVDNHSIFHAQQMEEDTHYFVMLDYFGIVKIFLSLLGHNDKKIIDDPAESMAQEGSLPFFSKNLVEIIADSPSMFRHEEQTVMLVQGFCSACLDGFKVFFFLQMRLLVLILNVTLRLTLESVVVHQV
jgi:hypothetical protein